MRVAVVREVSDSLDACELTYKPRLALDVARARHQHAAYVDALRAVGCHVVVLPAEDALPDAVFVEDPMLVLDECAVILASGVETRSAEVPALVRTVEAYRPVVWLTREQRTPKATLQATLEGGDVLRVRRDLFVGRSRRTNDEGIARLRSITEPLGYQVHVVDVSGCLHLKTSCTYLGRHLLINDEWIDPDPFTGIGERELEIVRVSDTEPWGANTLAIGDRVLCSTSFPDTRALITSLGYDTLAVDISELEKAEAGLTCLSVVFEG